ncbi:hypothetical protein SLEP1_g5115 [Rubroshorea leprosula]|uniref:Uncharacterized protein n=1 Tax=Rubroshorea leprosula TaxID=152421 RepID=A0AAV5HWT1_9ROSI|nr:hypothetical protein SLEP1_g5115 [Rubroshorea leprosula]
MPRSRYEKLKHGDDRKVAKPRKRRVKKMKRVRLSS